MDSNPPTEFDSHPHAGGNSTVIFMPEHSKTWNWILSMHNNLLEDNNSRTSFHRMECFAVLVEVACKILGKLDENLNLSKCEVHLKFFHNICGIAEKIITDMNISTSSDALEVNTAFELIFFRKFYLYKCIFLAGNRNFSRTFKFF